MKILKAFNGNPSVRVRLHEDPMTRLLYKDAMSEKYNIDADKTQLFTPNMLISEENELLNWWLKIAEKQGFVALDVNEDAPVRRGTQLLYVIDKTVSASNRASMLRERARASSWILNNSESKNREIAVLLGIKPEAYSADELITVLMDIADTNVTSKSPNNYRTLLALKEDADYHDKLLVARMQMLDARDGMRIEFTKNAYRYGDTMLGISLQDVLSFIRDPKNVQLVTLWREQANPKKSKTDA